MPETKTNDRYEFVRLSDLPDLAELCASFHATVTGEESPDGLDMRYAAFRKIALDGEEEDGIVALYRDGPKAGQLAGMAVLVRTEMEAFEDLGPWVTGLAVRSQEAALRSALVSQLEMVATELEYGEIFAQTQETEQDKGFFEMHGYREVEPFKKAQKDYWVMGKAL